MLPATFNDWRYLGWVDLFRPLGLTEEEMTDRSSTSLRLVGRRSHTLTRAQADGFIASFGRRLAAEFPAVNAASTWRTLPLTVAVAPDNRPGILGMVIGLSGFVLLIACSNLANLLLARTMARAREFAVRGALGASRARLLRPLFVESLLLALAGGLCAIQVAVWSNDWLRNYGTTAFDQGFVFAIDWRVLGWAFGACLFTALVFGVAPALFALRLDLNKTLKSGGRGTTGDRGHQRFRDVLSGRAFNEGDTLNSPKVFIINQAMAHGLFGGESPLGRRIAQAGGQTIEWGEIVGVVGDVQSIYPDQIPVPFQL